LDQSLLEQRLEKSVSEGDNGGTMSRHLATGFFILFLSGAAWAHTTAAPSAGATSNTEATKTDAVPTDSADAKDATYLICKNKAVVRTLRVSTQVKGGCVATYTKNGIDQVVGHSWTTERCAKVIANIRENLEKANWKCKDISEARVSSSESE
jgi:hypothetical protein